MLDNLEQSPYSRDFIEALVLDDWELTKAVQSTSNSTLLELCFECGKLVLTIKLYNDGAQRCVCLLQDRTHDFKLRFTGKQDAALISDLARRYRAYLKGDLPL